MIKQISSCLLMFLLLIACKGEPKNTEVRKPKKKETESKKSKKERIPKVKKAFVFEGSWQCYKFEKDNTEKAPFSESYAVEYSRYASFKLTSDSILLSNGTGQPIYSYAHSTKNIGYDGERPFIDELKPKKDSVKFYAQYNGSNRLEPFTLMMAKGNDLVLRDRGYYFFFNKRTGKTEKNTEVMGCPADARNYFIVEQMLEIQDVRKAYQNFKKDFPFAAEKLAGKLPNKGFVGAINGVEYDVKPDVVIIRKNVPEGTLKIEFRVLKVGMKTYYEIEYMEFG